MSTASFSGAVTADEQKSERNCFQFRDRAWTPQVVLKNDHACVVAVGTLQHVEGMLVRKSVSCSKDALESYRRGEELCRGFKHPCIVRIMGCKVEMSSASSGVRLHVFMEYVPGPNLFDWLLERKRSHSCALQLLDVLRLMQQLLQAVDYLHSRSPPVVHGDIKLQNIVVTPSLDLKLCDFGLASTVRSDGVPDRQHKFTSEAFSPPETCIFDGFRYSMQAEMWAVGLVFKSLLHGWPWVVEMSDVEKEVYTLPLSVRSLNSPSCDTVTSTYVCAAEDSTRDENMGSASYKHDEAWRAELHHRSASEAPRVSRVIRLCEALTHRTPGCRPTAKEALQAVNKLIAEVTESAH